MKLFGTGSFLQAEKFVWLPVSREKIDYNREDYIE